MHPAMKTKRRKWRALNKHKNKTAHMKMAAKRRHRRRHTLAARARINRRWKWHFWHQSFIVNGINIIIPNIIPIYLFLKWEEGRRRQGVTIDNGLEGILGSGGKRLKWWKAGVAFLLLPLLSVRKTIPLISLISVLSWSSLLILLWDRKRWSGNRNGKLTVGRSRKQKKLHNEK